MPIRFLLLAMSIISVLSGADLPPDGAYVQVRDGHLTQGGERLRLWGAIGHFPGKRETRDGDPYFRQKVILDRLQQVGFNAIRIWHLQFDDAAKAGDLSATDVSDYFVAEAGRRGVKLWGAAFGGGRLYDDELAASAKIIDDPASEAEWVAATTAMCRKEYWSGSKTGFSLTTPRHRLGRPA